MLEAEDGFNAFVCGVDFSLSRAAGCHFLSSGNPVNGAIEQDDEAGKGSGFEEGKF